MRKARPLTVRRSASPCRAARELSPSDINYRANIDVLKRAGVTDLVSLPACGSFKEESPPGTFVLIDQFVGNSTDCRQKSSRSTAHC